MVAMETKNMRTSGSCENSKSIQARHLKLHMLTITTKCTYFSLTYKVGCYGNRNIEILRKSGFCDYFQSIQTLYYLNFTDGLIAIGNIMVVAMTTETVSHTGSQYCWPVGDSCIACNSQVTCLLGQTH